MRAFFRSMPWSFGWFALTGVIFLLQWFPYTGVFLMLVAAAFWSVATINLGFLSIIVEVVTRRISVAWLVLPLVWFGGYAAVAHLSQQQAVDLDAQVRALNAGQRIAFAPDTQALVFDSRSRLSGAAGHFVREYRVPVAYQTSTDRRKATHRAERIITDPLCQHIRSDKSYNAAGIYLSGFHTPGEIGRRQLVRGMCAVSSPEDPELPAVVVEAKEEKHNDLLVPHKLTRVSIYAAGGESARLVAGIAEPLRRWLPRPYMGCFLNSGAARWDCVAGFGRERVTLGGTARYSAVHAVIAAALGLQPAFAGDRHDEIAAVSVPSLDRIVRTSSDDALATLDAVLADPTRRITVHDLPGLAERPELLGDRAPRMVEAVRRALGNGRATYETARVLQRILAQLPARDFDALAPALLSALDAQRVLNSDTVPDTMAVRLGRLGAPALASLERLAFANPRRPNSAALYGLCRLGADAAPLAERIAALATPGDQGRRDYDTAAYAALMRMGHADLVEREKASSGRFTNIEKRVLERQITPADPPGVCVSGSNWPRVPE